MKDVYQFPRVKVVVIESETAVLTTTGSVEQPASDD